MRLGEHFQTYSYWAQQLRRSVAGKTADLWCVKDILKFRNITPEPAQDAVLGEYDSAIASTTKLGPPILPNLHTTYKTHLTTYISTTLTACSLICPELRLHVSSGLSGLTTDVRRRSRCHISN